MNMEVRSPILLFTALLFLFALLESPVLAQDAPLDGTGGASELANTVCPVTPVEAVDPSFFAEYKGRRVYFCCKRCRARFNQAPEAYVDSLAKVMPASLKQEATEEPASVSAHESTPHEHEPTPAAGAVDHEHADAPDDHDHAADHGVLPLAMLGRMHVVVIHFPIALLLLAGLLETVCLLRPSWRAASSVRILVGVGALSAVSAAGLGLLHGSADDYVGTLSWVFWWHRALGLSTAALSVAAWVLVERRARVTTKNDGRLAVIAVISVGVLVGVTGHFGGSLVYGWNYLIP